MPHDLLVVLNRASDLLTPPSEETYSSGTEDLMEVIPPTSRDLFTEIDHVTSMLVHARVSMPRDLLAGFDRISRMLEDTIKILEDVARSSKPAATSSCMPFGLQNTARVASDRMKKSIQIQSEPSTFTSQDPTYGIRRDLPYSPCPIHKKAKHTVRQCHALKKLH